jgi:hypothetical protein
MCARSGDVGLMSNSNLVDLDDQFIAFPFRHDDRLCLSLAHDSIIPYLSAMSRGFFSFFLIFPCVDNDLTFIIRFNLSLWKQHPDAEDNVEIFHTHTVALLFVSYAPIIL